MQQPMTGASLQGRLINESRELLAFGDCEMHTGGEITMRVAEEHAVRPHRSPGPLTLVLDDGRALNVSNRFVRLRLSTEALRTIGRKGLEAYAAETGVDLSQF